MMTTTQYLVPVRNFRIFRNGKLARSGTAALSATMSDVAPGVVRICVVSETDGVAIEVAREEALRASAEIRAGALSARVAAEVTQLADRLIERGEMTARLTESRSRDVVHLAIWRLQILLAEVEIDRIKLDDMRLIEKLDDRIASSATT